MAGFDWEKFGQDIVYATKSHVERSLEPIMRRLDALEALPKPQDGKSVTVDDVRPLIDEAVSKAVEADDMLQVIDVIADKAVARYVKDIPVPQDGKDADPVDMDVVRSLIVEECKDIRAGLESTLGPELQISLSEMVKEAVGALPVPRDGTDGKDIDMDAVRGMVDSAVETRMVPAVEYVSELVKETVAALPVPKDGKDADPVDLDAMADRVRGMITLPELPEIIIPELPDIAGMVKDALETYSKTDFHTHLTDAVSKAVAEIPVPLAPELPDIAGMVKEAVDAIDIPKPQDGKSVTVDDVRPLIDEAVSAGLKVYEDAVKAIPLPQDGKSVTVDDVRPLIDEAVSKAVAEIPVPKDGKNGVDAVDTFLDNCGHLIFTFSDGRTKDVGQVVGDDGVDCDFERVNQRIAADIKTLFEAQPKPRDGFGFDDLSVEYDGERTIKMVFQRGDERKEFPIIMPVVLDRGVYTEGKTYARGDSITWAGSRWIAQKDNVTEKPGTNGDWLLSVKRGQAGKDGVMTVAKPPAPVKLGDK